MHGGGTREHLKPDERICHAQLQIKRLTVPPVSLFLCVLIQLNLTGFKIADENTCYGS
jgi:hypothetical protein